MSKPYKDYELKPFERNCDDRCDGCQCRDCPIEKTAQKKLLEYLVGDSMLTDRGWIKLRENVDIVELLKDFGIGE